MNNWTYKYRSTILTRVWAILLLAIFINATLIESLHHHEFEKVSTSKQKVNTATHQDQLTISVLKCQLCDLIKQHSHFYTLPTTHLSSFIWAEHEEKSTTFILAKSSAFVLLSSNKGPPSIKA